VEAGEVVEAEAQIPIPDPMRGVELLELRVALLP
jgi:hypothetical protein